MADLDVLIVSHDQDCEARTIEQALLQSGFSTHYFDYSVTNDRTRPDSIALNGGDPTNELVLAGQEIGLVQTILFRRPGRRSAPSEIAPADRGFADQEQDAFLANLLVLLECHGHRVFNGLHEGKRADNKAYQLRIAGQVGLLTSPTLISNDLKAIERFRRRADSVIIKGFMPHSWREDGRILGARTTALSNDYELSWGTVQAAPCIYQKRIEKILDVRVLVLGNKLFALGMRGDIALDWRPSTYDDCLAPHPIDLPKPLCTKIHAFMARLKLSTASLDFCVDTEGRYYFLEVNEMGQSLFWEELCPEFPILREWVRFLTPWADPARTEDLSLQQTTRSV